jgi:uncharacterized protein YgiM (DUF1202 family)
MSRKISVLLALMFAVLIASIAALVSAQDITPLEDDDIDATANLSWPPPVYTLRGEIDIRGSANAENMTNYFIEFRPLVPGLTPEEIEEDDSPWFPATLPSTERVTDDILGTWNTETAPDGIYEMRLVVNINRAEPVYFRVSPVRIENDPPDFVVIDEDLDAPATPTPGVSTPRPRPTLAVSPTSLDNTPRATANLNANVRSGDSTLYPVVAILRVGETARIVGISTTGSGWYLVELGDGTRGWISPSTVTVAGDLRTLQRVSPPPVPATPTPTRTNTPVPSGNLTGSAPSLNPNPPTCNVTFSVLANITNNGTSRTNSPAAVIIRDVHVASGTVTTSIVRELPQLDPGANFVVGGDLLVTTFFDEQHRVEVIIDSSNQVIETNETDNLVSTTYTLARGAC